MRRSNRRFLSLVLVLSVPIIIGPSISGVADEPIDPAHAGKVLEQARSALVQVELFLKHSAEDELEGIAGEGDTAVGQQLDRQQETVAAFKQSVHLMGAILSRREVVVVDTGVDSRRISRWEITDSAGRRVAAQRAAIFLDTSALVLEPSDPDDNWKDPAYADVPVDGSSTLTVVAPVRSHLQWVLRTTQVRSLTQWSPVPDGDGRGEVFWGVGHQTVSGTESENSPGGEPPASSVSLVFNSAGQLLGVASADRIYADRAVPSWRAADLRKGPRVTWNDWQKTQDRIRDGFSNVLYPVRIEYRRPRGGAQAFPDSELLGWAVSEHTLLVPAAVHRQVAARIDKVTVQVSGRDVEARFLGQCKEFDVFTIQLADALPAHSRMDRSASTNQYRGLAAVTPSRRYGQNDVRVNYTRPYGSEFGYRNRPSPVLAPPPPIGSIVCDLDGNPAGLFLRNRRPLEELELYESMTRQDPRRLARQGMQRLQQASSVEFFPISRIATALENSNTAFDPHVVQRTEQDEDRRVWLGVEFNPLTRELAESLGCRKESKDGAVGLMINQVYAGSPADHAGLRSGDVLLALEVPERDHPVLLTPHAFALLAMASFAQSGGNPRGGEGQRTPWPSRNNYLTNLLATIGENTPVKVRFWRDGKAEEVKFAVALAPPDQDSAAQFKDEKLGVTVKEITYEVRTALKLKPDDPGVVVAKIESGSPAARARISQFEIIQSADGEPLSSPSNFEQVLKKAVEEKNDQIRLVVVDRGRQRFADLKLGQ